MYFFLCLQNFWKILERKRRKVFFFQFVFWFFFCFKVVCLCEFFFVIVVQFFSNYNSLIDVVYFFIKFFLGRLLISIFFVFQIYFFLVYVFMLCVGYWVKEVLRFLWCCWNKIVLGFRMFCVVYYNLLFEYNVFSDVFNFRRRLYLMMKMMNILSLFIWSLEKMYLLVIFSKYEI